MEQRKHKKMKICKAVLSVLLAINCCTFLGIFTCGQVTAYADSGKSKQAETITLCDKNPQENIPFAVSNMFPGDSEPGYYRIRVSYHDEITVYFNASVRVGYEKLAEVMKVRIRMYDSGEVIYDGLMRDMPESITYKISSKGSTTDELLYEITAYLDTTVGNEYQNKDLIADFNWWAEARENLDKAPKTGDYLNQMYWIIPAGAAALCIILFFIRRNEVNRQNG